MVGTDSVHVMEPATGDEVVVKVTPNHVDLFVREESGAAITVSLGREAARELAAALEAAVKAFVA